MDERSRERENRESEAVMGSEREPFSVRSFVEEIEGTVRA